MSDDDPELDGTDFAHPAWWRGERFCAEMIVDMMKKTIGGEVPTGTVGNPGLHEIRQWIADARDLIVRVAGIDVVLGDKHLGADARELLGRK